MKTASSDQRRDRARQVWEAEVLDRLRAAAGPRMFSKLAELTECNSETVRRYMRHGKPSAYFMARICRALDISPEWLFMGTGPMHCEAQNQPTIEHKPRKRMQSATGVGKIEAAPSGVQNAVSDE